MNLKETIKKLNAMEGKTLLRVVFTDGEELTGVFTEYTSAGDNDEGIASIDVTEKSTSREYSLFEDEIAEIHAATKQK